MSGTVKNKSFFIVTHVYATGPAFFLEEYLLKQKVKKLLFLGLPFSYAKEKQPFIRYYEKGKLLKEKKYNIISRVELLLYLRDVLLTIFFTIKYNPFDIFIGVDNLNASVGILLRNFFKIKKIIFYTIDYVPNRFPNKLLNLIYHKIEKFAVEKSDYVWNLSPKMISAREENGYNINLREKQLTVPIGTNPIVNLPPYNPTQPKRVVYMGHLRKGQGVEMLLDAFTVIYKKDKKIKLRIIGGGELEVKLKQKIKRLKLEKVVEFYGFISSFDEVRKLLSECSVAVAPYEDIQDSFTRNTDPGKVKDYVSMGLPVVVCKVPQVAFELEKEKAGLAVSSNSQEIAKAVLDILEDSIKLNSYRKNAIKFAKKYTWDNIFSKVLQESYI